MGRLDEGGYLMKCFVTIMSLLLLCGCAVCTESKQPLSGSVSANAQSDTSLRSQAESAVRRLQSNSDSERQEAMQEIRLLGSNCSEPLISLLRDLLRHRGLTLTKSASGGTGEFARVDVKLSKQRDRDALRPEQLLIDVIALLGDLKAQEAVPLLIQVMNNNINGSTQPEVYALRSIGIRAVPYLIEDLDESRIRSYGVGSGIYARREVTETDEIDDSEKDQSGARGF